MGCRFQAQLESYSGLARSVSASAGDGVDLGGRRITAEFAQLSTGLTCRGHTRQGGGIP
jgi:hypothetical protein